MKTIDIKWLRKIESVYSKQGRTIDPYRKDNRCGMSVLIDRYFRFLDNKYFVLKINEEIFYAMFFKHTHTIITIDDNPKFFNYGVAFAMGYNDYEFNISFYDEKLKYREFTLKWNDIVKIEYKEISQKTYLKMVQHFHPSIK